MTSRPRKPEGQLCPENGNFADHGPKLYICIIYQACVCTCIYIYIYLSLSISQRYMRDCVRSIPLCGRWDEVPNVEIFGKWHI